MDILFYIPIGFIAQIIDGALGMAYGLLTSSLLISFGVAPAIASATVHTAECFTSGASGIAHHSFGNVDKKLFKSLLVPGILGAVLGAYLLSTFSGENIKPYIASYLAIMGLIIIYKAFKFFPPKQITSHLAPLGFTGAFLDSVGGGGWGPIVASNLIVRGNDVRKTIGSVNAVEFFVTLASSLTFFLMLGLGHGKIIFGLALGGVIAAPFGAWASKHIPHKPLMILVGSLIVTLSVRTLYLTFL